MNALIFAAGLGTRLRPLTDTMPKALVPVAGEPLLEIILRKISGCGFNNIVVNAHHFAEQIGQFLNGRRVKISYEPTLLDTGGGLRKAFTFFGNGDPVLVHNVDILSNADLPRLYASLDGDSDVCLLVSRRETTRYLLFDSDMRLAGWTNTATGEVRSPHANLRVENCTRLAFSGIHVASQRIRPLMARWPEQFPLIDFYVRHCNTLRIKGVTQDCLRLLDVGKTAVLATAAAFLKELNDGKNGG
ncbi:MAG: NTP transferase domain-containing protein [Prevotella sp.]|nr:NTP transferase domain-containing protein [Prevotella sp.]